MIASIPIEELRAGDTIRNMSGTEKLVTGIRRDGSDDALTTADGVLYVHAGTRVQRVTQ